MIGKIFSMGVGTGHNWRAAVDQCSAQLERGPNERGLGVLYASDTLVGNLHDIVADLRQRSGVYHWIGTVGNGICATGREFYETPALVALVLDLADEQFRVLPTMRQRVDEVLEETAPWRAQTAAYCAVVHGDPRNPATPKLITDLAAGLDGGFLIGGLTSSNQEHKQVADEITDGGLSGVLLSREVALATGLSQGCSLIGGRHVITECQRNILVKIDERPALDVFKEEIGELLARDLSRVAGYIFVALPIAGSDTGDYLVRNLIGIDPENKLLAIGDRVSPGEMIQFARRDGDTAREDLVRMLRGLRARVSGPIRGALYHTCLGRGRYLFGPDSAELKLVQQEIGDVPLVGFYANGEIHHNRLYGYTGVLTLLT